MSAEATPRQDVEMPQSAAAPSPFTPIANYGFLSNCHTGALVAPDGTVDWLCVPRFDSPSVFGALLDRGAGGFRFGPFGINVPSDQDLRAGDQLARHVVEDAHGLGGRARRADDGTAPRGGHGHTPHPTAVRRGCRPRARADRRVHRRHGRDRPRVRARVRLWPRSRRVDAERRSASSRGDRGRAGTPAADRHAPRHRGGPGSSPPRPARRRDGLLRARLERGSACPDHRRGGRRAARGHDDVLARLARARGDPRPRARPADPAVGADDQGPHVHADRRDASRRSPPRCRRRPAASGTGTTATPGSATRPSCCGRCTTCCSTGRPTSSCSSSPTSSATTMAACRSCTGSTVAGI